MHPIPLQRKLCRLPVALMPDQSDDHYDHRYQEHQQGNPVHAMHKPNVDISWFIRVSLAYIEIRQYLLPHSRVFV